MQNVFEALKNIFPRPLQQIISLKSVENNIHTNHLFSENSFTLRSMFTFDMFAEIPTGFVSFT